MDEKEKLFGNRAPSDPVWILTTSKIGREGKKDPVQILSTPI